MEEDEGSFLGVPPHVSLKGPAVWDLGSPMVCKGYIRDPHAHLRDHVPTLRHFVLRGLGFGVFGLHRRLLPHATKPGVQDKALNV